MTQGKDWVKSPITRDEPPSSEGSLFAATLALGESTSDLADRVEENTAMRKGLVVLVVASFVVLVCQAVYGSIALDRITRTDTVAANLTSERAQRDQIARADFRYEKAIYCVNSYIDHKLEDRPYDTRCPTNYPAIPLSEVPSAGPN
jgi:hypothetical protein